MELSGILAISGYPGLFKMIGQTKGGVVVESLLDGKRMAAYSTQRILSLEDITIYTEEGDVKLTEVLAKFAKKEKHGPALNPKKVTIDELKQYFAALQPDYDRERVYNSDLKKLFVWYNLLAEKGLTKDAKKEVKKEELKEKDKPAKKKKASKKETASAEEKPKKKKAPKAKKAPKTTKKD